MRRIDRNHGPEVRGVLLLMMKRPSAQSIAHEGATTDRYSLRSAFSTSAIVIIIVMGSTGKAENPAFW